MKLPWFGDVLIGTFVYGLLFSLLVNFVLIELNVVQEINLLFVGLLAIAFVYFDLKKFIKVIK